MRPREIIVFLLVKTTMTKCIVVLHLKANRFWCTLLQVCAFHFCLMLFFFPPIFFRASKEDSSKIRTNCRLQWSIKYDIISVFGCKSYRILLEAQKNYCVLVMKTTVTICMVCHGSQSKQLPVPFIASLCFPFLCNVGFLPLPFSFEFSKKIIATLQEQLELKVQNYSSIWM